MFQALLIVNNFLTVSNSIFFSLIASSIDHLEEGRCKAGAKTVVVNNRTNLLPLATTSLTSLTLSTGKQSKSSTN